MILFLLIWNKKGLVVLNNLLGEIPKNSRICIYGDTGTKYTNIKRFVELFRPDIKIICFLELYRENENIDGTEVINITDVSKLDGQYDSILISITSCCFDIEEFFIRLNILNYNIFNYPLFESSYNYYDQYGLFDSLTDDSDDGSPDEQFLKSIEKAKKVFKHPEDVALYEAAVNARLSRKGGKYLARLMYDKLDKRKMKSQYFDFINKDAIKNIIDGGAYIGETAVSFIYQLKNLEHIYGFEPLYDNFSEQSYADCYTNILKNTDKFSICRQGLWSSRQQFSILDRGGASCIVPSDNQVTLDSKPPKKNFLKSN